MRTPIEGEDRSRPTYRERHRERRRREFLATATEIVAREGADALTMKRVTDVLECSEGSIYQYFPTKGALVAEVQAEAIQTLGGSLLFSQAALASLIAERDMPERTAALTRVVGAARFWVAADAVFPREMELTRALFTSPTVVVDIEDGEAAALVGTQMLEVGAALFDAAVAVDALSPGDGFERTVVVLAATTGLMMASEMARWDARVADTRPAANEMLTAQFLYWGADRDELTVADEAITILIDSGMFVVPVAG